MTHRSVVTYTTGQVAEICNAAPRTVCKWFDTGRLGGYRIPGSKNRRIPHAKLVKFMQANGIPLPLEWDDSFDLLIGHESDRAWAAGLAALDALDIRAQVCHSPYALGLRAAQTHPIAVLVAFESSCMPFSLQATPPDTMNQIRHLALVDGQCSRENQAQLLSGGYHKVITRSGPLEASVKHIFAAMRPSVIPR